MNITGTIKYFLGDDYARMDFSESHDSFSIDIIMVPASVRGTGIGTILLNHVISLADNMKKDIFVSARPIGATNDEKLKRIVNFYEKYDFEIYDTGLTVAYMKRETGDS